LITKLKTAPASGSDERPGQTRSRRRGPRSMHAIIKRKNQRLRKQKVDDPQPPRAGDVCFPTSAPALDLQIRHLHANIQGLLSHKTELEGRLKFLGYPEMVSLNETFLNQSVPVGAPALSTYSQVSRRDRKDGRQGGGIALYALVAIAKSLVHVGDSDNYEKAWHILHSNLGPILIAVWYRPPSYHECDAIATLETEWRQYATSAVGALIIGD